MNQDTKNYIDKKLFNACCFCHKGEFRLGNSACYPPPINCNNCGKSPSL